MVDYLGRNASFFLILSLLNGCAGDIQRKETDRALALGVGHFREKVVVKDDSLEHVATFDTSNGFVKRRPLLSGEMKEDSFVVVSDWFAEVDRKLAAVN